MQSFQTVRTLAGLSFKSRNEGSILGIFWYLLNPLLMFTLLLVIFSTRLGDGIPQYPLYLLLGIIMFNFFRQTTAEATNVLEARRFIVKNTTIQPWVLVAVGIYKYVLSHLFEILAFAVAMAFFGSNVLLVFAYIPIGVLLALFSFGIGLILMMLNAYIADIQHLWQFFSQILWFATPIFYAIEGQTRLYYVNLVNPMYYFIESARSLLIYGKVPEVYLIVGMVGSSVVSILIAGIVYSKLKTRIAEMV